MLLILSQTVTDCFQVASSFSKMVPPHTPHDWRRRGLPPIVQSSSVRMNVPKFTGLKPPRLPCLGCYMLDLYQKYQPRPTNISELKVALQSIWNDLPQDPIDRSILSFTKRLRACIKANGGHFEYRAWLTNCIPVATICCTSCSISVDWQHYEYCIVLCWTCTVLRCKFLKCLVTFCWWFW